MTIVYVSRKARMTKALAESLVNAAFETIWENREETREVIKEEIKDAVFAYSTSLFEEVIEECFPDFNDAVSLCEEAFPTAKYFYIREANSEKSVYSAIKKFELANNMPIPYSMHCDARSEARPVVDLEASFNYEKLSHNLRALEDFKTKSQEFAELIETLRTFPSFKDFEKSILFEEFKDFVNII